MTEKSVDSERLRHVYSNTSVEQKLEIYKEWAETYDRETQIDLGYIGPVEAAKVFAERVPDRDTRILDAGCGTGQVGIALCALGYRNIHGVDFSPEMLAIAERHKVYTALAVADLSQALTVDEPYDAAISVGLYGVGPPFPEHLHYVVDAVRPKGLTIFTVNGKGWEDKNWAVDLPIAVQKHGLILVDLFEIEYITKEDIRGKLVILQRPDG